MEPLLRQIHFVATSVAGYSCIQMDQSLRSVLNAVPRMIGTAPDVKNLRPNSV